MSDSVALELAVVLSDWVNLDGATWLTPWKLMAPTMAATLALVVMAMGSATPTGGLS